MHTYHLYAHTPHIWCIFFMFRFQLKNSKFSFFFKNVFVGEYLVWWGMSCSCSWRWRFCKVKGTWTRILKFYIEYVDKSLLPLSRTLSERSESIDKMKLQAIGQRNIYESERSERKRKRTELTNLIKEKLRELDRQTAQLDSLTQVEREQQALIEKLTSSD